MILPNDWTVRRAEAVGLRLYDTVFLLGIVVTYEAWTGKFFPDSSPAAARRSWDRWLADIRALGLEFRTQQLDSEAHAVVFQSKDYVDRVVDWLCGPADPQLEGVETMSVYDFFPGETHDDVEELIELLAEDLKETE